MEKLTALRLSECNFEHFGSAILPVDDMTPHSISDAELIFNGANLRYYVTVSYTHLTLPTKRIV